MQRLDRRGFAGWTVHITRRTRLLCSRYFSDRRYGGRERSLAQALAYRDKRLRALPPPELAKLRHSRNTTGTVGVHEIRKRGRSGVLIYYVGTWVWPPRSRHQRQKCFSVRKHGMSTARALAIEARRDALRRIAREEKRRLLGLLSRVRPRDAE